MFSLYFYFICFGAFAFIVAFIERWSQVVKEGNLTCKEPQVRVCKRGTCPPDHGTHPRIFIVFLMEIFWQMDCQVFGVKMLFFLMCTAFLVNEHNGVSGDETRI